jgi:hypothetical protein
VPDAGLFPASDARYPQNALPCLAIVLNNYHIASNQVLEVEMKEQNEKAGCLEKDVLYPHGSEFCKDMFWEAYCFKCLDGKWETRVE